MAQVLYKSAVMDVVYAAKYVPEKPQIPIKEGYVRAHAKCVKAGSYIKEGDWLIIDVPKERAPWV